MDTPCNGPDESSPLTTHTGFQPATGATPSTAPTRAGENGAEAVTSPDAGDQRGRYTILKEHACGGLGKVSLALDSRLHRQVALKEIRADRKTSRHLRRRFIAEAEITGMLEHPGIVPIYVLEEDDHGQPYYAMRFVQGRTLSEAIRALHGRTHQPLSKRSFTSLAFRELLQRFVSVCQTIAYAHSKGVLHRDLKPPNVMLGDFGETLVLDWGVAKRVSDPSSVVSCQSRPEMRGPTDQGQLTTDHEQLTQQGHVVGTAAYMSPEQARGEDLGPSTDIYALGAILYELLTGRRPYQGRTGAEVLGQVGAGPPQPIAELQPNVPKPLVAICRKAMARRAEDRYAVATDLAKDVACWLGDEPVSAYPEPLGARTLRWARHHRTLVATAVAMCGVASLALMAGLLVVTGFNRQLERSNTDLLAALDREAAAGQRAQDNEKAARLAQIEAERQKQEADEAYADTKAFSDFLVQDVLAVARPEKERGGLGIGVTVRHALDEAAKNIPTRFAGRPKAEALARHDLGVTYRLIGELAKSETELSEALRLRRKALGGDHEDTLRTMNSLAVLLGARGRIDEALPLYEEALKHRRAKLGPEHSDTLLSMNNLASTYQALGRTAEALPIFEEILKVRLAQEGAEGNDTLTAKNNLARALQALGRVTEAVPLFEEALKVREVKLGPEHPQTLISKSYLALAYRAAGRVTEAMPLFEDVLKVRKAKLGPEHPDTLTAMSGLAAGYQSADRHQEALGLYEKVLQVRQKKLGLDHPDTLTSMTNLAGAYQTARRVAEALALLEEAVGLSTGKQGRDHPHTLIALNNLASAYQATGQLSEAIALFEETLQLKKTKLGVDHPSTLISQRNLASAYQEAQRLPEALALFEKTLDQMVAKNGAEHPDTLLCDCSFGLALVANKDYRAAEQRLLACHDLMSKNRNVSASLRQRAIESLVRLYDAWGKPEKAETWRAQLPPPARLRDSLEQQSWTMLWGWPRF